MANTEEERTVEVGVKPAFPWYVVDKVHPKYPCAGVAKIKTITKVPNSTVKAVECVIEETGDPMLSFSMPKDMHLPIFVKEGEVFRCYIAPPKTKMDSRGKPIETDESDYHFILEFKINGHKVWLPVHMLTREV